MVAYGSSPKTQRFWGILTEWTRPRGGSIVNGDAVPAVRVTLELSGVLEREALHVLLRDAPGYIVTSSRDS